MDYGMVKEVVTNFVSSYKKTITTEQKKRLLHLLIKKITIGEKRKINSIHINFNNEVVRHFTKQGEEKSSNKDDFSSPFSIEFTI